MPAPTIDRKCHWLRRNRSSKRPEWLCFVDAESSIDPLRPEADLHTFRLGWACLCHYTEEHGLEVVGWHKIEDPLEFWHTMSQVADARGHVYVISHNIDYDARVLHAFSMLPGIGWEPDYVIISDSCHFFTFKAGQPSIALLDNLNYWQLPLEDLGLEFGIPKLEVNFASCTDEELSTYCHRDVEILVQVWQYWLSFLDEHDLGDWAITTAGQAWNAYRHRFMPCKIGIHNRADALELERQSYKGGRCEVWRMGKFIGGPFYKLDVNGLYAYCMREFPSPQKLVKVLYNVDPPYLRELLKRYDAIADVLLEAWDPLYAIRLNGYNVFPIGQFRTSLTTPELEQALDYGHIRGIGAVAIYERQHLFTGFIDYLTPLRQKYKRKGDTGRSLLCKMIRNSLYGKFGQKGYSQEVIGEAPLDVVNVTRWVDGESGQKCIDWTFGGKVIRQTYTGEGLDSFPAIATHVAAYGRQVLWNYAMTAGLENVFYADTDSLIVNAAGKRNLEPYLDAVKLGHLKIEAQATDIEIFARKSYSLGPDRTIKGIKRSATEIEPGHWKQTQFTSLKWAFAHGDLDDVITYDVEREEHPTLYHGHVDDHGVVHPPELSLNADEVAAIIAPQNSIAWDWWIDPVWFGSLESHAPEPVLPVWYLQQLGDLATSEPPPLAFL
jgi:hypothetical protein